jgi:mRNA-degrading endonuclease RelE of RelBE toxin-antitoxin system
MWAKLITVAETLTFMRQADSVCSPEEREAFVDFIGKNPKAGDVIRETGGVRKVRWAGQGRGRRGGTRVIYFFHDRNSPIYLLLVYAKAVREDISPEAKKAVKEFATRIKQAHRGRAGRRKE